MKPPFLYRVLRAYVSAGLWIYFRKIQAEGSEKIPASGPCILVPNHQNAFLDALVVGYGMKRAPWFLARGDVFKKPWARRILTFIQIKPVFRFRDGHAAMRNNDRVIRECVDLLEKGECLVLFPEGNHNEPWTTRDLQKGFAQIAFQYMEQTGKDIPIVPVGIHFENHHQFGTRVLVRYGEPFSVEDATRDAAGRDRFAPLLRHTADRIRSMILVLPLDEHYPERRDYLMHNRISKDDLMDQLASDRELMLDWKPGTPDLPNKRTYPRGLRWLNPFYLYGMISHTLPLALMKWITGRKIKDKQFVGSVQAALGIFLIPAYYFAATGIFFCITQEPWWTTAFALSLPVSGLAVGYSGSNE